jgi:hypothetical protein
MGVRGKHQTSAALPPQKDHGTHWTVECVGPNVGLEVSEDCRALPKFEPQIDQLVA